MESQGTAPLRRFGHAGAVMQKTGIKIKTDARAKPTRPLSGAASGA
jgi:hypothetical protein